MSPFDGKAGSTASTVATVSNGIVITGNVECTTELQISGRVDGEVRGVTVFIDPDGIVSGGVSAERLRVSGTVDGTIKVGDLAIEAGGRVSGEVSYARIKIAAGGVIEGNFNMIADAKSSVEEKTLKLVDQPDSSNPRRVYVD